jgi:hypothetical protein
MDQSTSQFPDPSIHEYNQHDDSPATQTAPDDGQQVIVPTNPPQFGPVAARAMLRLLIAVHRARSNTIDTAGEEP